jgi:hypothetical protein
MEFKRKWEVKRIDSLNTSFIVAGNKLVATIAEGKETKANAILISKTIEMLEMLKIYLADLNNIIPPSDAQRNRIQDVEQLIKEATEL